MSASYAIPKLMALRAYSAYDPMLYPDSDGQPMADNDQQYQVMVDTRFALQHKFRDQDVYVGANLLIYFQEGDPTKSIAPDVFVALGVPRGRRRTFLTWLEGQPPDVVFEIASPRTWKADLTWKKGLYLGLGVQEYILFDPTGEYFQPQLQGFRLHDGNYYVIPPSAGERGVIGLESAVLDVELWAQANDDPNMPFVLRMWDRATDIWLPTPENETQAREKAEARAEQAEARLRELEDELRRLRGE
ncbi:MAG TPA: Uma2 family endonuclease [Roseiflexaceae bacterium]|nr:Uma2 family endonuclease [Roseiflexaceae bacterium]